eukprot:scaffold7366_cov59-Phaeocystis_antarctica.AAC.1
MPGSGFPTAWRGANWKVAGSAFYRASALAGGGGGLRKLGWWRVLSWVPGRCGAVRWRGVGGKCSGRCSKSCYAKALCKSVMQTRGSRELCVQQHAD